MTLMSPAALCKAVATANLRSFLFILIVQSVGCGAEQQVVYKGLQKPANVRFLPPAETALLHYLDLDIKYPSPLVQMSRLPQAEGVSCGSQFVRCRFLFGHMASFHRPLLPLWSACLQFPSSSSNAS